MIQPTYVTYTQAVWLKEKGFNEWCQFRYTDFNGIIKLEENASDLHPLAPEQWLVIEWLRVNHGIEVVVIPDSSSQSQLLLRKYTYSIFTPINGSNLHCQIGRDKDKNIIYFLNPQNAYSAAFDYIISNNLI